jgi:hypothetical protein
VKAHTLFAHRNVSVVLGMVRQLDTRHAAALCGHTCIVLACNGARPWVSEGVRVPLPFFLSPPWQDKQIIRSALKVAYKDNPSLANKAEFLEKVVQVGGW